MKIVVISIYPPREMPEADHAYHLCRSLAEEGHEVHVLCQRHGIESNHPRLHMHRLMKYWGWPEALFLAYVLRRVAPEAVLLNYVGHAYLRHPMLTFAASLTKRLLPMARFVTQVSYPRGAEAQAGLWGHLHKSVLRAHGKRASGEYGTLLSDSDHLIILSSRHLPAIEGELAGVGAKVSLIPPALIMPIAPEDHPTRLQTRADFGAGGDVFVFAYFGYLYPGKGAETLLQAFHLLRRKRDRIQLLLVGGGNESNDTTNEYAMGLKRLITELDLGADVRFTGGFPWDSDQGSRYLRAADAAVLPFDQGVSLNNSSFAAVTTHGLPTITTCGDTVEAPVIHGRNAFLCRPQDPEALMAALDTVAADAALRARLRAGALDLARTNFSWDAVTGQVLSALTGTDTLRDKTTV